MRIIVQVVAVLVAVVSAAFTAVVVVTPRQSHTTYVSPSGASRALAGAGLGTGAGSAVTDVSDAPAVLFVGDSYTAGALGVSSSQTFAQQACTTLGLVCNLDAEGSTGYQSNGHLLAKSNQPYLKRLPADARHYSAGLVIVSGGRNDIGAAGSEYLAARDYLRAVRSAYPKANIVVLEPFWTSVTVPAAVAALRHDVRRAALGAGATYVPTSGWLRRNGIAEDGVHPNREGHRQLAAHLVSALRSSGVLAGRVPA